MNDQEIIARSRELIETNPTCNLATLDDEGFPYIRPMYTLSSDDDLTIYFSTFKGIAKCTEIEADGRVSVSYSIHEDDLPNWEHAIVKGQAIISEDKVLKHRLWQDMMAEYFDEGPDDPNYVVIVVKPKELIYGRGEQYPPDHVKFQ